MAKKRLTKHTSYTKIEEVLAKNLGIAFVAYMGQTTFATALKNHGHYEVNDYWKSVAATVLQDFRDGVFGPAAPGGIWHEIEQAKKKIRRPSDNRVN